MKNVGVYVQDDKQNRKCVCVTFTSFILKDQTFALIHAAIWESDIISEICSLFTQYTKAR